MSGPLFDDKKNKNNEDNNDKKSGNVYETKIAYVNKVAGFLEDGVKEMKKNLKKL